MELQDTEPQGVCIQRCLKNRQNPENRRNHQHWNKKREDFGVVFFFWHFLVPIIRTRTQIICDMVLHFISLLDIITLILQQKLKKVFAFKNKENVTQEWESSGSSSDPKSHTHSRSERFPDQIMPVNR